MSSCFPDHIHYSAFRRQGGLHLLDSRDDLLSFLGQSSLFRIDLTKMIV